ncbi:glycosyltransferase [Priestia filamentosa]|uniref:glycosyltransferase n=1 Tax=Priestia filamentosa TaxID=1402861 RepID=UPI002E1FCA0A|nr:glycosyltransferase [Priestia filamentosa]MED3725789.1 glycosyltransferase [Priestia filamentosa]
MVFDVPAESGGALTILKQYYEKAIKDKENEWIFVISKPDLIQTQNVKILKVPWVKKSWFHRLYFDRFIAKKYIEEYQVDEVLSLQNVIFPNVKVKQTLYLHQSLPFVEKRYKITENFTFWLYQNVISKMIYNSIRKADHIIVQTNWMKEASAKKAKVKPTKFKVLRPELNIKVKNIYEEGTKENFLFFYPASGMHYKNHKVIVEAVKKLKDKKTKNFKVVFTINGDENENIKRMFNYTKENKLPIDFIGNINSEVVFDYYSKSILIFPSYIETFGLPLLEARMHRTPILASDCAFSHEVLENYENVKFFNPYNSDELSIYMSDMLK